LKLNCDVLLSTSAFKFNLRRYTMASTTAIDGLETGVAVDAAGAEAGAAGAGAGAAAASGGMRSDADVLPDADATAIATGGDPAAAAAAAAAAPTTGGAGGVQAVEGVAVRDGQTVGAYTRPLLSST